MNDNDQALREPSLTDAIIPVVALIIMLSGAVFLFGADAAFGASQIALLLAGGVAAIVGMKNGLSWDELQDGIVQSIGVAMGAILILLAVGALIGTWMLSGTVPSLIYYGLLLLNPTIFYAVACIICCVVSVATGSSWTTAGTMGVALMGVAVGLGVSPAVTAGAVISGAYFGDKMSPLSDTTNLAPAVAGSELFEHIRHMMWSTVPSITIAIAMYLGMGFFVDPQGGASFGATVDTLRSAYHLGPALMIPLVVVIVLAYLKWPALPTMMIGALLGGVFAVVFQPDEVVRLAGGDDLSTPLALLKGVWQSLATGYVADTGNVRVDDLLTGGGMTAMLNTVWLILCAMAFGGTMERAGLLRRLAQGALKLAKSSGSLIVTTILSCIGTNILAADQYIGIVLPGRLYREEYERRGLAAVNLSRATEDGGTITAVLIPWTSGGAYMSATLGIATMTYFPFAFFNLINPLLAMAMALMGIKILYTEDQPEKVEGAVGETA